MRYEFKTVLLTKLDAEIEQSSTDLLNLHTKQGWEFVQSTISQPPHGSYTTVFFVFRRQLS